MAGRSFRSVFMVASCAGAALGCYLVSLRVASERAALEDVETQIVLAQRDIRLLQTEIGTRGRLAQLERWNVKVLALSAPSADQFVNGGFELASMVAPKRKVDLEAPVVLASAPANAPKPRPEAGAVEEGVSPQQMMRLASLKRDPADEQKATVSLKPSKPAEPKATVPKDAPAKAATKAPSADKKAAASVKKAAPVEKKAAAQPKKAAADPLAPLAGPAAPKKVAASPSKDAAKKQ